MATKLKEKPAAKEQTPLERALFELHLTHERARPLSESAELTSDQWDALQYAVAPMLKSLQGLTLTDAVEVVRRVISTNPAQLLGLPKRFQVWKIPAGLSEWREPAELRRFL